MRDSLKLLFVILAIFCLASCRKDKIPSVTTASVVRIKQSTAQCGGQVIDDGGDKVSARGVCWSLNENPTLKDSTTVDSLGMGLFTSYITGLAPATKYWVRAYATNGAGTGYGDLISFTTAEVSVPELLTAGLKTKTSSTASCGGEVTNEGGLPVIARGVCWSTSSVPTIEDSHTTDGTGPGPFFSTVTGLEVGTTYHVRSYATNSFGTGYGSEITFAQREPVIDQDGNAYSVLTLGTQVWLGENLKTTKYNDGSSIPTVSTGLEWANLVTPAYSWYENNAVLHRELYGALYNWYAVNTGKLCPAGWHVPSSEEFTTLLNYLGGDKIAGGKLKESGTTHWHTPNTGATNGSGFTATPAGARYNLQSEGGAFMDLGYATYFWTSTGSTTNSNNAVSYDMGYMVKEVVKSEWSKRDGESVRCIQNIE